MQGSNNMWVRQDRIEKDQQTSLEPAVPTPKHSSIPTHVRNSQWRFHYILTLVPEQGALSLLIRVPYIVSTWLSAHLGVSNTPGSAVCQQKYSGMAGGSCAATEWFRVCDDFPHCPCSHSLVKEHFIHLWWMSLCCRINLLIPIFALHWELNQWYKKIILRISIRVSSPSFTPYNFLLLHGFVDPFLWGLEVSIDLLRVTGHRGCQWDEGIHNHRDAGLKLI